MKYFFIGIVGLLTFSSCEREAVYEENRDLKEAKWSIRDTLLYEFEIPDSTIAYDLFYNIRYNTSYEYYNLYVNHYLYDSSGNLLESRLMNMDLFDPATGGPKGSGISDIFDYRVLFMNDRKFPYSGPYQLKAIHYMRENPLEGIASFGLTIKKDTNKD